MQKYTGRSFFACRQRVVDFVNGKLRIKPEPGFIELFKSKQKPAKKIWNKNEVKKLIALMMVYGKEYTVLEKFLNMERKNIYGKVRELKNKLSKKRQKSIGESILLKILKFNSHLNLNHIKH